jgi:hypothetical protein
MAELITTFTGRAELLTANEDFPGPYNQDLSFSLVFSEDRKEVEVGEFAAISVGPFPIKIFIFTYNNTITIDKKVGGKGNFDIQSGDMQIPLTLGFDHSLFVIGDSDLPFLLTTGVSTSPSGVFTLTGMPLNPTTGEVTLVGASEFVNGEFDKVDCSISIRGTLAPSPFPVEVVTADVNGETPLSR